MNETTRTYEQFCTHLGRNVIMEEKITSDGIIKITCTNGICPDSTGGCKNKLRQKN
ncbi:MAG: hypothetical protein J1F23_07045 [Oscillospiraceae bacterium]|nr:hypothetical protein [Oscillospiraceae bacterium]